ncbi:ABC transporter ATP-binding protein [Lacticaseibacillus kribbianus]|uniref:ABC transporter ATP-binding protein n=1 Tax=Lacticaseibacillus kribbianus TaxID=2926292 RepID=UPI001CD6A4F1|nr:ABC transporter ATP-binding protein [Lacticaseibacillus kribbianus]
MPEPTIMEMFRFVFGTVLKQKGLLVLNVAALSLTTVLGFVVPQITQYIIDTVIPQRSDTLLIAAIAALLATAAVLAVLNFLSTYYMSVMSQDAITGLRNDLYARILRQDTAFFEASKTGDLMTRLTSDVNNLQSLISANMLNVVGSVFTFCGVLALLFWINWQMALAVSLTFPLIYAIQRVFRRRIHRAFRRARASQAQMSNRMQQTLTQIDLIKSYTAEPWETARFNAIAATNRDNMVDAGRNQALFNPLVDTVNYLGTAIVLFLGAHFIIQGTLSVGQLVAYLSYVGMVQNPIRTLARLLNQLQQALVSYGRIRAVSALAPSVVDQPGAGAFPKLQEGIHLDQASFKYGHAQILRGVSFDIPAGKTTALVGRSGAGKTTITRVLTRLYDLNGGSIRFDATDQRAIRLRDLRQHIAVVSQDIAILDGTVRDNIVYGRPGATDEDVWRVLELADLAAYIRTLSAQLDTPVGERGVRLSGGQKQRLAIARALLKDAPIIILDEATANLDNESEKAIQQALAHLLADRTALVIAHRLSTVHNADQIVVLDAGAVVEVGTHAALLARGGAYAALYQAQFA